MYLVTQLASHPGTPLPVAKYNSPVDLLFVRLLLKVEMGGEGESEGGKISGPDHHRQAQSHHLLILLEGDHIQNYVLYQEPGERGPESVVIL